VFDILGGSSRGPEGWFHFLSLLAARLPVADLWQQRFMPGEDVLGNLLGSVSTSFTTRNIGSISRSVLFVWRPRRGVDLELTCIGEPHRFSRRAPR